MQTFKTKADIDSYTMRQDMTKGIVKCCTGIVKIVEKESPELFDKICDMIENAKSSTTKYSSGFVSTIWGEGFSQISYEASRVPKAYAFVCILKQKLDN